jgi:hypothetical protein
MNVYFEHNHVTQPVPIFHAKNGEDQASQFDSSFHTFNLHFEHPGYNLKYNKPIGLR